MKPLPPPAPVRALLAAHVLFVVNTGTQQLLHADAFTTASSSSSYPVAPTTTGITSGGRASSSLSLFGAFGDRPDNGSGDEDDASATRGDKSSSSSFIARGTWRNRDYGQKSVGRGNTSSGRGRFERLRDEATIDAILERVLTGSASVGSSSGSGSASGINEPRLVTLQLAGRGSIPLPTTNTQTQQGDDTGTAQDETIDIPCLFLSDRTSMASKSAAVRSVPVPLSDSPGAARRQLKLLSFAHHGRPISKSLFLTIAPLLTGRDGSLWDNLPWTTWTVDPGRDRIVDAAGNPILDRFHPGKRDAFERMSGKDWYGRSLSGGNLKARLEYWLDGLDDISLYDVSEDDVNDDASKPVNSDGDKTATETTGTGPTRNTEHNEEDDSSVAPLFDDEAASVLAKRILEVEMSEASMAVAEAEEQLAVVRGRSSDGNEDQGNDQSQAVKASIDELNARRSDLGEVEAALSALNEPEEQGGISRDSSLSANSKLILRNFLAAISNAEIDEPAPYRGAYGYTAVVDSPEEMFMKSILPYRSPYDLLLEIISEQLNADVIGAALEDTSLFDGEVVLGGAVVLRRRGRPKSITIGGETIEITDEDDDLGSEGVKEGEIVVVECDADEAIGLALASDLGVLVETNVWETSRLNAFFMEVGDGADEEIFSSGNESSVIDSLPLMESPGYLDLVGDNNVIGEEQDGASSMPQPPKTTDAFLNFFAPKKSTSAFSTDNPVKTLDEYDTLSVQDKARIILSLQSFEGRLPRPRVLREAQSNQNAMSGEQSVLSLSTRDPLDDLLIPFVDESVRRDYLIRDAEKRGDKEEAARLREDKSKRQVAKERAAVARESDNEDEAERWEDEAELQTNTRADVTQDEGEYSRFLDKDEWYERDRLARVKRLNKSKFGTLLDDIE